MIVTINTDASFCHKTKLGAFAFWIVSNNFKIKRGGCFRDECENSSIAEMKCIINAFCHLSNVYPENCKVIVNTDSKSSIGIFTSAKWLNDNKKNPRYIEYVNLRKEFERHSKFYSVEFRHVKAHSGVSDRRSFVNDWCDKTAKYYLRMERKKYGD